jgi:hypothetical protein
MFVDEACRRAFLGPVVLCGSSFDSALDMALA